MIYRLGLWRLWRLVVNARGSPVLRILSCHRVIDPSRALTAREREDLQRGCLSLAEFRERITFLTRHYRIESLERCAARIRAGTERGSDLLVLTFDDGFRDVFHTVYPELRIHRAPFTVFLSSSFIGNRDDVLTADQIRHMSADPLVAWGAHGVTHRRLTNLPAKEAEREVVESRHAVELWTGRPVSLFAYPDGCYSAAVRELLVKHGFLAACATGRTINQGRIDLFGLKRIPLTREPFARFVLRVAGLP